MNLPFDRLGKGLRKIPSTFPFITRKRFYIPLALVLVIGGGFLLFGKPQAPVFETATVAKGDVVQVVSETGTVEPAQQVDLAFTAPGRIASVNVKEGQSVRRGYVIATLDSSAAYASVLSAQARLAQQEASYQNDSATHTLTERQQDQLVDNAKRSLVSGDLRAYLVEGGSEHASTNYVPPTISGTYTCGKEGSYTIELYHSAAQSGASMRYHGLEEGVISVSTVQPVPLGRCGLYIQFPSDFTTNQNILWEIPIPNVRSSTYQDRLNAYNAAVQSRAQAVQTSNVAPIAAAQIAAARADVLAAQAAYAQTRLVAPFSGTITTVPAVRGAIAGPGTPAASMISNNAFELTVDVPENDIGELTVGDSADVSFDAYDSDAVKATVSFISPAASTLSGAASFKVTLQFAQPDERIRSGLSANVDITTASRPHVVNIPTRAVVEEDGKRFVRVMTGETTYKEVPVTTGLSGSGRIEITSGLSDGERIITFANDKALSALIKE